MNALHAANVRGRQIALRLKQDLHHSQDPAEAYWVTGAAHELSFADPVDAVAYAQELLDIVSARCPAQQFTRA